MHDEGPRGLDVFECLVEAALGLGREPALDLDGPGPALSSQLQEQVDLGAGTQVSQGAVELIIYCTAVC